MLQNSKVAVPRIFRENKKRETITDLYTLSRGAEIAGGFNARGSVPSRLYTEDAPTARGIFDHLCKTTFATQSGVKQTSKIRAVTSGFDPGCVKTQNLSQCAEIGSTCDAPRTNNGSLRNVYAVVIARQSVFTQPRPIADMALQKTLLTPSRHSNCICGHRRWVGQSCPSGVASRAADGYRCLAAEPWP